LSIGGLISAEQLIDVALPIADVNTARRLIEQFGGLIEVSSHRKLFFFSIGTRVGLTQVGPPPSTA